MLKRLGRALAVPALGLAVAVLAFPTAPAQARVQDDTMTALHVAKTRSVTSALISPDGTHIAYTLSVPRDPMTEKNGGAWSELHITDMDGNTRPYITGKVSIRSVRWSPDGNSLTFLTKRGDDKKTSLYRLPIGGGEAQKVFEHKDSISSYAFGPEGKWLAFLALEPEKKKEKEWKDKGFDAIVYEENLRYTRLWRVALDKDDAEAEMLEEVEGQLSGLTWSSSADRNLIALTIAPTPLVDDSYMKKQVYLVDPVAGRILHHIQNPGKIGGLSFSPDGKHIATISAADKNDPSNSRLMVATTDGGAWTNILPDYETKDVHAIAWQTNDTLMYIGDDGAQTFFAEVKADGTGRKTILEPGGPILSSFSLSKDGTAGGFVCNTPTHPGEVYAMTHQDPKPKRLTNNNEWLDGLRLAKQELVRHKARDGVELEGLLIYPLDHQPGKRYPLILSVHGGPESHYSNGWITRYSGGGQVAAARGFAVFYPNYRGSTGRGVAFSKMGQGDAAGKEFDDLVDAVDHLIEMGLVDRDRVGITGGSYGGYASAWGATYYSDRFAASVMFVGISNNISKVGTTDIPREMYDVHHRKWLWEDWDYFLKRSPIYYIEKARTPTLIMHGKDDPRVHPGQSMELYRHLKVRGETPVRLVLFPGEGHGNRKAAGRLDYTLRLMRWMEHYLMGDGDRRTKEMPPPTLDYDELLGDASD